MNHVPVINADSVFSPEAVRTFFFSESLKGYLTKDGFGCFKIKTEFVL